MHKHTATIATLVAALLSWVPLAGQVIPTRWQDSSVKAILRELGPEKALRQVDGPLPTTLLDAIADSLVQRALHPTGATASDRFYSALRPIGELTSSGRLGEDGVPYARSQANLIRIVEATGEPRIAASALRSVLAVGSVAEGTDYLVRKALQADTTVTSNVVRVLYEAWEPGRIGLRPTTAAELLVVRAGLKRIWDGTYPRAPQGTRLPYLAALQLSRTACIEGWTQPASRCAGIAPVMRMADTSGRGGG